MNYTCKLIFQSLSTNWLVIDTSSSSSVLVVTLHRTVNGLLIHFDVDEVILKIKMVGIVYVKKLIFIFIKIVLGTFS